MIFSELLYAAKNGDAFATEVLLKMYHPCGRLLNPALRDQTIQYEACIPITKAKSRCGRSIQLTIYLV